MFPSVPLGLQVEAMCRSRQMPSHSVWEALLYKRKTQSAGNSQCHRKHNQVCVVPKGDFTSCLKLAHCLSEHHPEQRSGFKVMLPCVLGMLIKMHRSVRYLQKSVSPIISSHCSILLPNRPLFPETVGKRKLYWRDSDLSCHIFEVFGLRRVPQSQRLLYDFRFRFKKFKKFWNTISEISVLVHRISSMVTQEERWLSFLLLKH